MSDPSPGLYLVTPVLTEAESFLPALREALANAEVASLLLRMGPLDGARRRGWFATSSSRRRRRARR